MVRIISALILAVTASCALAAEPLQLVDNPPDRHVVVKGDTLWGISGKFLKQPWRWPEIWRMNKDQIKNPHLIYPGDIVMLDLSGGTPRLRIGKPINDRLQPQVHSTPTQQVISSIPPNVIEPFLSQPLIVDDTQQQDQAIRIITTQEDRMLVGTADSFYATGIPDSSVVKWQVFRPAKPLKDPETGKTIAHEAYFLGNASLTKVGEPATLRVTMAKEEMRRGDYLRPAPPPQIINYAPHRAEQEIAARVVSIYGGINEGGPNSIVSLNRGSNDGIEVGHVIALYRNRVSVDIDENGKRSETPVPEERYGLAFVFRVFGNISYALVMEASRQVIVGDSVRNP